MKRKPSYLTIVLIVLAVLLTIATGPIGNAIELPSAVKPYAWPLFLFLAFILGILALWQYFLQENMEQPVPIINSQNRFHLLAKVHTAWINGVLEQSLNGSVLITLGLSEHPDVVANPWELVIQQPDRPARSLPSGTRITQVYDEANGELLILGEPGSGKTTLLLQLTRDLIERAKNDETHPIPVVLNLSSWAIHRQPLADWLIEELNSKYQVPHRLGQMWVESDQILPLLDGLDEVDAKHRLDCVNAINAYRSVHGLHPLVVCSRLTEYQMQPVHLLLSHGIIVQPLTIQQIEAYLSSAEDQLEDVGVVLHNDPSLQQLASTPLMLSILTLAYHGKSSEDLQLSGSLEAQRQQVFKTYVYRMLHRRRPRTYYKPEQTERWLTWLAHQMKQHNQSIFFLEQLQPNWLPDRRSRFFYGTTLILLILVIYFGLFNIPRILSFQNAYAFIFTTIISLSFGALTSKLGIFGKEIQTVEIITWTRPQLTLFWKSMRKPIRVIMLTFSLLMLAAIILIVSSGFTYGTLPGLILLLILGFFITTGVVLSIHPIEMSRRIKPNQGIWLSAKNGMFYGLSVGLAFGLLIGLIFGVKMGMLCGLLLWLTSGLLQGGFTCIQHLFLRVFLWQKKMMPLNYVHFLNYAVECILLRRVGGGYIFIHPLLLEYFESLDAKST